MIQTILKLFRIGGRRVDILFVSLHFAIVVAMPIAKNVKADAADPVDGIGAPSFAVPTAANQARRYE